MSETSREPVPVSELVQRLIEKQPFSLGGVLGRWEDIVGEQVARYAVPVSLKKGVLKIHVLDSVWKHHMELNARDLICKINSRFPVEVVSKLVVKVGPVEAWDKGSGVSEPEVKREGKKKKRRLRKAKTYPLTPESKKFIKELRDPELKQLARRLLKLFPPEEDIKSLEKEKTR
ncbi:DciA family protein [Thermodesulforhabdus norvegica]|uniref:DUF721 domain-containing protein n=1 Tax=Thermodesulforhabdus norvegica TaxID=39841 RepID=A0A1I4TCW1_9BACT|nr:DUF721 domain-containing protein [Thermodesulforhabdus norvegica]SFM74410.1 Protein of unknown function [Thermodesulforhabdus norvegica]